MAGRNRIPMTSGVGMIGSSNIIKLFPQDCGDCEHLIRFDMSIDDWTNICKINNIQVDDCDEDWRSSECPNE